MKKWVKRIMAFAVAAVTLFGIVGCGKVETPSFIKEYLCVEHTYGAGEVERWATCIREGRVKHTCTECGHVKYETLTRVSHTPYTVPAREATCAQTGYTEHTACAVCGLVMNNSKTTIEKIPCTHENDFYAGMGVYECGLCSETRKKYQETVVLSGDYCYLNKWYRCYYSSEESRYTLTFTVNDRASDGELGHIVEHFENVSFWSLSLIFDVGFDVGTSTPTINAIIHMDDGTDYDAVLEITDGALWSGGHDYTEIVIQETFTLSGQIANGLFVDVAINGLISMGITAKVENNAKLVKLEGVPATDYPEP